MMRIATFNVQNLYHRDTDLYQSSWSSSLRKWMEEFEQLLCKSNRKEDDFFRMRELSFLIGFQKVSKLPYLELQRKGGNLYGKYKAYEGMARDQHFQWKEWIKLASQPLSETSVYHKSRVILEGCPHILLLQEIEDRFSLESFVSEYLPELEFSEQLFMDGNDHHGRGLALLLRKGYHLKEIRSHSNDRDERGSLLFDKDIQEYVVESPTGEILVLINCHLKGDTQYKEKAFNRRKCQISKVRDVYRSLLEKGEEKIVICGTLNAVSYCDSLSPLLRELKLKDISRHPSFRVVSDNGQGKNYHSLGAYGKGINIRQKDYMLFSPQLEKRMLSSGMNRKGIWPSQEKQWSIYATLQRREDQASAHPYIWCSLYEY